MVMAYPSQRTGYGHFILIFAYPSGMSSRHMPGYGDIEKTTTSAPERHAAQNEDTNKLEKTSFFEKNNSNN